LTRRANQRHKFIIPEIVERPQAHNMDAIILRASDGSPLASSSQQFCAADVVPLRLAEL
jgi:hypothetical protein